MTGHLFDKAALHFAKGDIPWKAATTKMYLALTTVTPNQAAAEVIGDITEITGGEKGYTTGGAAMTLNDPILSTVSMDIGGVTATYSYAMLYGSDVSWANFSATAGYAVAYYKPDAGSKYVVGYLDLHDPDTGNPWTGQGGTGTVKCPTNGWFGLLTP